MNNVNNLVCTATLYLSQLKLTLVGQSIELFKVLAMNLCEFNA